MTIYETDTFRTMQYQSATTGWTQLWNMPWGVIGRAATTGDLGPFGATADCGATLPLALIGGRIIKVTAEATFTSNVAGDSVVLSITDASNAVLGQATLVTATSLQLTTTAIAYHTPPGGAYITRCALGDPAAPATCTTTPPRQTLDESSLKTWVRPGTRR